MNDIYSAKTVLLLLQFSASTCHVLFTNTVILCKNCDERIMRVLQDERAVAGMPDVTRSDSQRSDASLRPRVSFNRDVHVKRIGTNTQTVVFKINNELTTSNND